MRTIALVAAAVLSASEGREAPLTRTVEEELTRLKQDLVHAYVERDAEALARIYCEDFTVTDARGESRTKAEELASLRDASSRLISGTYVPIAIRVFGDVAVLYGHGELEGENARGPYRASYDSFNVFLKRAGGWCYAAAYTP